MGAYTPSAFPFGHRKRLGSVMDRSKDEEERWIMRGALRALNDLSHSPDDWIMHREKPDFLLKLGGAQIGIEVCEAIGQRTAQVRRALAEAKQKNATCLDQSFGQSMRIIQTEYLARG